MKSKFLSSLIVDHKIGNSLYDVSYHFSSSTLIRFISPPDSYRDGPATKPSSDMCMNESILIIDMK